jgi:MYXO-CTERM domain-containing protein
MTYRRLPSFPRPLGLGALAALGLAVSASPARAAITLAADAAATFEAKVFQNGLSTPTDLAVLPDGRVIIIQKGGDIATVPAAGGDPIEDHIDVNTASEQGLLGIIPDPAFATNQYIYVYADKPGNTDEARNNRHQILRYKFGADSKLGTKTVVLDMGLEGPANHDGGGIDIYGGNLYMGVGDTGANSATPSNRYGSCLNKGNGKVLRISLADATLGQPPADNPLVNVAMVTGCDTVTGAFKMMAPDKRIFAWGFRNPYRLWVDKTNGKVWVGDVGEVNREEIDIVQMGKHYGYPFREGTKDWMQAFAPAGQCMGMTPASECIAPVFDYDRVGKEASVIGGRILDGCDWPAAWKSRYIFGDYNLNKVWTVDVNATRDGVVANSQKDFATSNGLTAMRMGTDNALYLLEEAGTVTRVTIKGATVTANSCPSVNAGPTVPGGGGSAATGGASGSGGAAAGGNAPVAGQTSAAGEPSTAGSGGAASTAGSSATTAGTTASTAGTTTSAGGGGTANGTDPDDSGGCGCQVVGGPAASTWGLTALMAAFAAGLRRRRGYKSR